MQEIQLLPSLPIKQRRHLSTAIHWRCNKDENIKRSRTKRTEIISTLAPIIRTERDEQIALQLIDSIHVLCLCEHTKDTNQSLTEIILPHLLPLLLPSDIIVLPSIETSIQTLLSTLCQHMTSETTKQVHDYILHKLEGGNLSITITVPFLNLIHAMSMGNLCTPILVSHYISSRTNRCTISHFLRSIISQPKFHQQWSNMALFLLYTYCIDSDPNAKQCLTILWSRPGQGMGHSISLLLANTINVSFHFWQIFSKAMQQIPATRTGSLTFHGMGSSNKNSSFNGHKTVSVIVRYGNVKQENMIQRILLNTIQNSILIWYKNEDFSIIQDHNGLQQISLSVLAGIQALIRASLSDNAGDVDVTLLKLCRVSTRLTKYVQQQFLSMPKKQCQIKKGLINRLTELINTEQKTMMESQQRVPCRPSSQLQHHPPRFVRRKRPSTAKVGKGFLLKKEVKQIGKILKE